MTDIGHGDADAAHDDQYLLGGSITLAPISLHSSGPATSQPPVRHGNAGSLSPRRLIVS